MIFEAIRTVEIAAHGGADGKPHIMRSSACSAAHAFKSGAFIEVRDDAAFGKTLNNRVVFIEFFKDGKQIELNWRIFSTVAFEQINNGHVFAFGHRCADVVARYVPARLPCCSVFVFLCHASSVSFVDTGIIRGA